jgi:hypothetical protein
MSEYKNLYQSIDGLNQKIKKLETNINNIKSKQLVKSADEQINSNIINLINTFRIHFPKDAYSGKKFVGLLFDSNFNNFDSDEYSSSKNLYSFIKLTGKNIVINYSIQINLNFTPLESIICSLALGIKNKSESKIKIINGSKSIFDLQNPNVINNILVISNTILYTADSNDELCFIVDFGAYCTLDSKKSLIKLLYL